MNAEVVIQRIIKTAAKIYRYPCAYNNVILVCMHIEVKSLIKFLMEDMACIFDYNAMVIE